MPSDPWRNRQKGMLCETCMFFVPKARADNKPTKVGRCRRNAPSIKGYPVVFLEDFCGEHKLDENKA